MTGNMASKLRHAGVCKTALLLVDIQVGISTLSKYYGTERSTPKLEENVASLLTAARKYNSDLDTAWQNGGASSTGSLPISIIHVFHRSIYPESPLYGDKPGLKIMPCARPVDGEMVLPKSTNSAFGNDLLEKALRSQNVRQLIICGLVTDHCVSTTTRFAADWNVVNSRPDAGDEADAGVVALVSDATGTFNKQHFDAETVHSVNLASLEGEFAEIVTTEDILSIL